MLFVVRAAHLNFHLPMSGGALGVWGGFRGRTSEKTEILTNLKINWRNFLAHIMMENKGEIQTKKCTIVNFLLHLK